MPKFDFGRAVANVGAQYRGYSAAARAAQKRKGGTGVASSRAVSPAASYQAMPRSTPTQAAAQERRTMQAAKMPRSAFAAKGYMPAPAAVARFGRTGTSLTPTPTRSSTPSRPSTPAKTARSTSPVRGTLKVKTSTTPRASGRGKGMARKR